MLGQIQAGLPVHAEENLEGSLPLPRIWAKDDKVFVLRVKGDSMKDAHILSGDLALVRQQVNAENGEIGFIKEFCTRLLAWRFRSFSGVAR